MDEQPCLYKKNTFHVTNVGCPHIKQRRWHTKRQPVTDIYARCGKSKKLMVSKPWGKAAVRVSGVELHLPYNIPVQVHSGHLHLIRNKFRNLIRNKFKNLIRNKFKQLNHLFSFSPMLLSGSIFLYVLFRGWMEKFMWFRHRKEGAFATSWFLGNIKQPLTVTLKIYWKCKLQFH